MEAELQTIDDLNRPRANMLRSEVAMPLDDVPPQQASDEEAAPRREQRGD
jgi:hypothetical protein